MTMLSVAIVTAPLIFDYDHPTFLLAELGVGIADGSFSVKIRVDLIEAQ
jgi:MFS transporter, NNP family, nitrate/nitrite transporter